jgi:hypothetical protein
LFRLRGFLDHVWKRQRRSASREFGVRMQYQSLDKYPEVHIKKSRNFISVSKIFEEYFPKLLPNFWRLENHVTPKSHSLVLRNQPIIHHCASWPSLSITTSILLNNHTVDDRIWDQIMTRRVQSYRRQVLTHYCR